MPPRRPESRYRHSQQTRILSEFMTPCGITVICPTNDGSAWTCDYASKNVRLLDRRGEILCVVGYAVYIRDMAVSPLTQNLWACSHEDHSIMECTSDTPTIRFHTDHQPYSLCVTADGHILVGTERRITKYNADGKLILTSYVSNALSCLPMFCRPSLCKAPSVCTPHRISECPMTQNLAVVDLDWSDDGGKDRPHVIVMSKDFQEVFNYNGNISYSLGENGNVKTTPFYPCDARYDKDGQLVVGDRDNRCLHLLSGRGQYLRRLYKDPMFTQAIGIDDYNVLWSVFGVMGGGHVKLIHYNT